MLPEIRCVLRNARVHTEDGQLIITTGKIKRTLAWCESGFTTRAIREIASGQRWSNDWLDCDWQLPDGIESGNAELLSLKAVIADDEGFTSEHISVTAEIAYPQAELVLRYVIWVYPDAPGLRTHLLVKRAGDPPSPPEKKQGIPPAARVERVPVNNATHNRRWFGYYNDTQNRNDTHQNILKEETSTHALVGKEWCDWASAACLEGVDGGIALVKESHKCVNQQGYVTGGFEVDLDEGLTCAGWGLHGNEISADRFTPGWATWCLAWSGGDSERELAFKTFDALRYPIDPARDIYIQANTWGSTNKSSNARHAAVQDNVLPELESCAEIGIEVLQIDDGWQVPPGHPVWDPGDNGWHPHPECYPDGWTLVRERAAELGLKLGLWAAAQPIGGDELLANYRQGGFGQFKLDFAHLRNRAEIDALMDKVRQFVKQTGHRVRVNWDVTENSPRYGYFYAREYGCIYLENRKPERPVSVVYRPHTVLRDLWQVSKYLNLHRFQCSIQNVDRVSRTRSDAYLHSHSYATAIALMGIPLFFQETKYYSDTAKAEIRELLDIYKQVRHDLYRGIVHPIGNQPDNASWTGFQCYLPGEDYGYLMLFRERCNPQSEYAYKLGWLQPGQVRVKDLLRDITTTRVVRTDGEIKFRIEDAPGVLFLRYELV